VPSANVEAHKVPPASDGIELRPKGRPSVFTGPLESLAQAPLGLSQTVRAAVTLVLIVG
jgi:hypothetical protein